MPLTAQAMRTVDGVEVLRADDDGGGAATPWGLLTTTVDGTIVEVNACFAAWTGRTRDSLRGLCWRQLLAPASTAVFETEFLPRLAAQGAVSEIALDLVREGGDRFPVLASALRRTDGAGRESTAITVFDATGTRRYEQALHRARREAESAVEALAASNRSLHARHEQLRVTLRSIADAVMTTDVAGRITSFNPTAEAVTGLAATQALGASMRVVGRLLDARTRRPIDLRAMMFAPSARTSGDLLLVRDDGGERLIEGTVAPIRDERGQIEGSVLVWRDVTQRRADVARREFEATHDPLTGLSNRREFERRVALALDADGPRAAPDLLLCLDLDQFKVVNDTAGPTAGDQLLVQVGDLLRASVRQSDVLARLGGDEFGVLLAQCPLTAGAKLAEKLRVRLEDFRFIHDDREHALTVSIGLAVLPERGGSADAALASADMACHAAKEAGRNRVHVVDAEDDGLRHRRDEMDWASRIRSDIDGDRFELFFQPIVRVDGAPEARRHGELLLRLRDEAGNLVAPGAFIGAAERYHQMGHLDRWVIRAAFDWLDGIADVQVSINVSGQSFGDSAFLAHVIEQMSLRRFDPSRICFEITETAAIADLPAALRFIAALRERGCRFALDDFGAGLSSFGYLRTLPVDFVKIDGSFVKTMVEDPVSRAIVESIHRVARLCGLRTVAEWVETEAVLAALGDIGVDLAQGWCVGRPVPVAQITPP